MADTLGGRWDSIDAIPWPWIVVASVVGCAACCGLGLAFWPSADEMQPVVHEGQARSPFSPHDFADIPQFYNSKSKIMAQGYQETPLSRGAPLPSIEVVSWLDKTPAFDELAGKVVVIDVWDGSCPYCSGSCPAIVRTFDRFRDEGVAFIGMTSAGKDEAQAYVDYLKLPWPNAYDAGPAIDALRANAPTIYVVGRDGRVLWNDSRSRFVHNISGLEKRLAWAIEQALSASG